MPNAVVLPVNAGILPQGTCVQSYQELANALANIYTVTLPTESDSFVIQSNAPDPSARGTKFWLQLDTLGRPVRIYWYAQGYWLSKHPVEPYTIQIWTRPLPDFTTFDGGDAGALTDYTGPMWEVASELNGLFPVGAQSGSPTSKFASGTLLNPGDTGGEEKHVLTTDELPAHNHFIANKDSGTAIINGINTTSFQFGPAGSIEYELNGTSTRATLGLTSDTGGGLGHNTLPPYLGVTFLKRTTKLYYSVL